ncbi:MAG: hypothetical protein ABI639_06580 [Thermoanaerobaculia bacterium]
MSRKSAVRARIVFAGLAVVFSLAAADAGIAAETPVAVANTFFSPATVTIYAGEAVRWTNTQGFHNASADSGLFRCSTVCGPSSGPASASWNSAFTFDNLLNASNSGTVPYHCEQHGSSGGGGMSGKVIVQRAIFSDGFEGDSELEWAVGTAAGDSCANPIVPAIPANDLAGDLRGASNDLDLTLDATCLSASAKGRDRVYQIVVQDGDVLVATVTPVSTGFDPSVYIIAAPAVPGQCAFATYSCLGSSGHASGPGGAETATYTNLTAAPETVLVVVDSIDAAVAGSEYTVDITSN